MALTRAAVWTLDQCICDRLARVDPFVTWQEWVNVDKTEAFVEVDVDACRRGSMTQATCGGM